MASPKNYTVDCDTHGRQIGAIVCRHMINAQDRVVGFVENSDDPNDLQAWCDACEAMFLHEGELTETFKQFCDLGVVCTDCYQLFKATFKALKIVNICPAKQYPRAPSLKLIS